MASIENPNPNQFFEQPSDDTQDGDISHITTDTPPAFAQPEAIYPTYPDPNIEHFYGDNDQSHDDGVPRTQQLLDDVRAGMLDRGLQSVDPAMVAYATIAPHVIEAAIRKDTRQAQQASDQAAAASQPGNSSGGLMSWLGLRQSTPPTSPALEPLGPDALRTLEATSKELDKKARPRRVITALGAGALQWMNIYINNTSPTFGNFAPWIMGAATAATLYSVSEASLSYQRRRLAKKEVKKQQEQQQQQQRRAQS